MSAEATSSRITLDVQAAGPGMSPGHDDDVAVSLDDPEGNTEHGEQGDLEDTEDEEDVHAYELDRQRRIRENEIILNQLGITPTTRIVQISSGSLAETPTIRRKRPKLPVYDRAGFIISLPGPGERHRMACVEMPGDRHIRRRIADGEYTDCTHWSYGEDRRWQYGKGEGGDPVADEPESIGGVATSFRWRRWRGLDRELRLEMRKRGELNKRDTNAVEAVPPEGESSYQLNPLGTCHQCKRRSEKEKMRCRNVDPVCRAIYCETCCKRYSYFDFDPESRSFICPLCKDICNCANCIRKRNLAHLLGPGKKGITSKELTRGGNMTVQAWLEQAVEEKVGVPFDRVRLVDQATDIISPVIQVEEETAVVLPKTRKRKRKEKPAPKVAKESRPSLKLKLKIPPPPPPRAKEVDSDGDTVGGYSDDDSASSRLTSLSPTPESAALKATFSPRSHANAYLASISAEREAAPPSEALKTKTASVSGVENSALISRLVGGHSTNDPASPRKGRKSNHSSPRQSPQSSVSPGGTPRRRKPPPKANIVRAPKHSTISPPPAQTWQSPPDTMQTFQSFSYDGYSTVPPPATNYSMHMTMDMSMNMINPYPPPYSHSPPSRLSHLQPMQAPTSTPQNLDLLSIAASEARQSPAVDDERIGPVGRLPQGAAWLEGGAGGLAGMRRYHPDYP